MIIKILSSNFTISEANTKQALKAIADRYPDVKQHALYRQREAGSSADKLQIALYLMGYHIRVMNPGTVIDMKSIMPCALIENDFYDVMKILSNYTPTGSYLKIKIDNSDPQIIRFDDLKNSTECEDILKTETASFELVPNIIEHEDTSKKRGRPRNKR